MKVKFLIVIALYFSLPAFAQWSDTGKVQIQNLESSINSIYSDYGSVITSDGLFMYFTSRRPVNIEKADKNKQYKEEIYRSMYNAKTHSWSEAELMDVPVNVLGRNNSVITISNDGQRMLLYRDDNFGNGDIYESDLTGTEWSEPVKLPEPINSKYHESSASISPDGRTIYFVSKRPTKKSPKGNDKNIWYCTQDEHGFWSTAIEIGAPINTTQDEEMAFIHPDGKTLFFSSKGHNSMGGFDIFMSVYDESKKIWGTPENLDSPINTVNDDVGFVMQANGKIGYYSSSHEDAIGEKDIYRIIFRKDIMKKHLTLYKGHITTETGNPINAKIVVSDKSTGEHFGTFSSNSNTGNYSISLPEGKHYYITISAADFFTYNDSLDVPYSKGFREVSRNIFLKPKLAYISGAVLNEDGSPLRAQVEIELIDSLTHQLLGKFKTDAQGLFHIPVPPGKYYDVVLSKSGYFYLSMRIKVPDKPGYEVSFGKNIILPKVEVGKKTIVNNLFFDVGKATLRQESVSELNRALKLMNDLTSLQIEVSGHTDNIGNSIANQKLSESRAKAVVDYLISKGIDASRLKYVGSGSQYPVASNDNENGRQLNRRTEFRVLQYNEAAEQATELQRLKTAFATDTKQSRNNTAKKSSNKILPDDFKQYDTDRDESISPAEISSLIDIYFEGGVDIKFQNITDLIDYYLED